MYVYIIKDLNNKLYTGISKNPDQRLFDHKTKRGALLTKCFIKPHIVFTEKCNSYSAASKRERQIKKWRRNKKERLIIKYQLGIPTKLTEI
jgi:putative endonuclease